MRNALIMSVFMLACSSPSTNEMPNTVLSQTEMISIITDVHLLKGKISVWRKTQAVSQLQEDSLFQLLYEKHNTSEAILDSSLTYYTLQESELLEQIYTEVIEVLKKQEADLGNSISFKNHSLYFFILSLIGVCVKPKSLNFLLE